MIQHPIEPVYDQDSRILILGSFPSVKSRENQFFYGHPQNRFWKVLAAVLEKEVPVTIEEKRAFLLSSGIALWDVIASCEITGSSDSSIKDVKPTDLTPILNTAQIQCVFVNGKAAQKYYNQYQKKNIQRDAICLPSTSPANAAWSLERLIAQWSILKKYVRT